MCLSQNDVQQLDRQQTQVNEAAFNQNWIVYGPAGTGKTILALNRLQRLVRMQPNEDHVYVSKSKMLSRWVEQAAEEMGIADRVQSFDQYIWHKFKSYTGQFPITLSASGGGWGIDWAKSIPLLTGAFKGKPQLQKLSLILDEAQDIEVGFFEACKVMCSRVFILMDENQKTGVFADTKRSDIARILDIDQTHQRYLGVNYRNPKEIKALSENFYVGDRAELASSPPKERQRQLEADPVLRFMSFEEQAQRVLNYCATNPQSTVCVVAPQAGSEVTRITNHLASTAKSDGRLTRARNWSVRNYLPQVGVECTTDFCSPGVVVSNAINLKGSEYDAVFLMDWHLSRDDRPAMYTLICRARARIEVFANVSGRADVIALFKASIDEGLIEEVS